MLSYLPAAFFNIRPIFLALSGGRRGRKKRKKKKERKEKKVVARFISLPEKLESCRSGTRLWQSWVPSLPLPAQRKSWCLPGINPPARLSAWGQAVSVSPAQSVIYYIE